MNFKKYLLSLTTLVLMMSACAPASPQQSSIAPETIKTEADIVESMEPTATNVVIIPESTTTNIPQPDSSPLVVGPNPEDVPAGYNPLTGLPVADPATLDLPAVLVSITNFPPSSRPQSGLSFSPWVFEMYISEGMTRYLAAFYGNYPKGVDSNQDISEVGPVRSGRLPYIYIRDFFQNSCLVYAGATVEIRAKLRGCASVFGDDTADVNSAMLDVTRMQAIAEQNKRPTDNFNYSGNLFAPTPQGQGAPASTIDVFYSFLNQGQWQYDPASSMYLKFEDLANGSGQFRPATDRLTGEQLAFSNVIVLYVEHIVLEPYIIDMNLGAGQQGKATVFRNGQKFDIYWTTVSGEYEQTTSLRRPIRFVDENGNPFALKPGNSWVHMVTTPSEVQDKGAETWRVRFYAPAGAK